jgi:hypothetical protein
LEVFGRKFYLQIAVAHPKRSLSGKTLLNSMLSIVDNPCAPPSSYYLFLSLKFSNQSIEFLYDVWALELGGGWGLCKEIAVINLFIPHNGKHP